MNHDTTRADAAEIDDDGPSIDLTQVLIWIGEGKRLIATQEFEDPEVLDNRGVRYISWRKVEGDHVTAYDCDPSIAENYAQ